MQKTIAIERSLIFLLSARFGLLDIMVVPDYFVRGDRPAYDATCAADGKSDISPTVIRICAADFGPMPGIDSRNSV